MSSTSLPVEQLRRPIAQSWRRASMAGLRPETVLDDASQADVDLHTRVLAAAGPVLEELEDRLRETGMSTVLVNPEAHVVHRWCGGRAVATGLDNLGIGLGTCLSEELIGTNGPGTALETRSSIVVHAGEHFAERLRGFSCYGHPIFHPATRRLEGALDISAVEAQANPLLGPLVAKAVADIEQRLLEGSRVSERILLAAFRAASRRVRPILALADDLLLSNQAASDLLESADIALLRNLTSELTGDAELDLELCSGQRARVRAERVPGAQGGALIHISPVRAATIPAPRAAEARAAARTVGHVHVAGPAGAGRSTRARALTPEHPCTVLTGGEAVIQGTAAWAERFTAALAAGVGTVCVDGVDLLPVELVDLVAAHAATRARPHLVLTSGPRELLSGPVRALTASCGDSVELLPLSHRVAELGVIITRMLEELGAADSHHLTPGALRILGSYSWPGNLTELRAVLALAVAKRSSGGIVPADLPPALVEDSARAQLSPIARAERQAIVAALRASDGNKVRAAQSLGISRTTLYARMRSLKVQTY